MHHPVNKVALCVGQRLRARREQLGFTLDDVCRRSGGRWSTSALSLYERGRRGITMTTLAELADSYRVEVAALLAADPADAETPRRPIPVQLVFAQQRLHSVEVPQARPAADFILCLGHDEYRNGELLAVCGHHLLGLAALYDVAPHRMLTLLDQWRLLAFVVHATDDNRLTRPRHRRPAPWLR